MSKNPKKLPEELVAEAREAGILRQEHLAEMLVAELERQKLPVLPPDEEAELAALHHLSDDALWTIARAQMQDSLQARMQTLMDRNSLGQITAEEYAELEALVERGQKLTLRKAEAAAILTERRRPYRWL